RRVVAGEAQAHPLGGAAEPGGLCAVELGPFPQPRNPPAARERTDEPAVFSRGGIKIICPLEAAGPPPVLRHHPGGGLKGVAWKMLAEMSRQQPAVRIVAAAHAVADEERNGLAAVEILDPGGASALRREGGGERGCARPYRTH